MTFELDFEKYQNESLIRANFIESQSPHLSQNYTFKFEQKRCFRRLISIKVRQNQETIEDLIFVI